MFAESLAFEMQATSSINAVRNTVMLSNQVNTCSVVFGGQLKHFSSMMFSLYELFSQPWSNAYPVVAHMELGSAFQE